MKDQLQKAREALVRAQNGLKWYRDAHPEDDSGADDEMDAEIDGAITDLSQLEAMVGEPVHQFRKEHCADWHDGHADHSDGSGPYEERTLYRAAPVAPQPQVEPLGEAPTIAQNMAPPVASWDDSRTQKVYEVLVNDNYPPKGSADHWEGWKARLVVDALFPEQPQAKAVPADQAKWCAYVAGVIGCYLGEVDDSAKVKAITGIIERRMWASAHQPLKIAAWRGVHVDGDYLYYDEFPDELTDEQRRQLHLKPLYEGAAPQQAEAVQPGHHVVVATRRLPSGRFSHTIEADTPLPIGAILHTQPQQAEAVPPTHVLVPVEPTEAMRTAAEATWDPKASKTVKARFWAQLLRDWNAMLAAAKKEAGHE